MKSKLTSCALLLALLCANRPAAASPLVALPAATESFNAGTVHVDRFGTPGKRVVILIPGLACGPWEWGGTIAQFAQQYDIYALTLPGFDGVQPATAEPTLFGAFERDLNTLIVQRGIVAPALIGHSLGGTLALAFAEDYPALPGAVVTVDGLPVFPTLALADAAARDKAAAEGAAQFTGLDAAGALAYQRSFMANLGTTDPALVDPAAVLLATSNRGAVAQWLKEDLTTDLRPNLVKIAAPVLEVMPYNAADRKTPPANYTQDQTLTFYRSLFEGTRDVTVDPIANARHFVMLDQPDAFYAAVALFLDAHK